MANVYLLAFFISTTITRTAGKDSNIEYPPYDGWYNNFAHPEWGAADTAMLRQLPPAYGDGVYTPSGANRPNPLDIAAAVFDGETGLPSRNNKTALLVFFGQQVFEEILDVEASGCPPTYFNIQIPKNNPLYDPQGQGGREMPFIRSRNDARTGHSPNVPRSQLNEVTPFFDGNLMYGPNKAWSNSLRLFKDGLLAATNDSTGPNALDSDDYYPAHNDIRLPFVNPPPPRDHILKPVSRFYKIGNPRGNENPFLLTFGILWFRYHNFRARQLKANHPDWDDEQLFNEARKWVIAVHQKIVYYDWLPAWMPNAALPAYTSYNPHIHPQISHVFHPASKFGSTLVPPGVFRRDSDCHYRTTSSQTKYEGHRGVRLCNSYWNPQEAVHEYDIDELLMGMASQIAEREDHIVTPDLHGSFHGPLEFSRRDLMAMIIQRGRDHGLPDYNTARVFYGLPRVERFEDINNSTEPPSLREAIDKLAALHNNSMDDVDIWAAGMLETTDHGPGPLFSAIIENQLQRIRDGDRFWFENYEMNRLFTKEDVEEIRNITLKQIIMSVTHIKSKDLQDNVFVVNGILCLQPVQLNPLAGHMESCTRIQSFNYFDGNSTSFILTMFFILFSVVVFAVLLFIIAKYYKRSVKAQLRKQDTKKKRSQRLINDDNTVAVPVVEWMGPKEGTRTLVLTMNVPKKTLTLNENNSLVRMIDFSKIPYGQPVTMTLSSDAATHGMMIRVPRDYDLILSFDTNSELESIREKFDDFLKAIQVPAVLSTTLTYKEIKQNAVTRVARQKLMDTFFTTVMARALDREDNKRYTLDHPELIDCEMTKHEFASALGLRVNSSFVTNMFKFIDKNSNGLISFRELLDFFVIFSKGSGDDKAKLMFDMNDLDGDGALNREEFIAMLKSLIEMSNEKVEEDKITELVSTVFANSGFNNKPQITFQDFQRLINMSRDDVDFESLSLDTARGKVQGKKKRENARDRVRRTMRLDEYNLQSATEASPSTDGQEADTVINEAPPKTRSQAIVREVLAYFENHRRQIFWIMLYTLVVFGIFIERAYVFSVESEVSGLRRICGYGFAITRGAGSVIMFTYSSLLVTMCRNIITYLRDTILHHYIPFDDIVSMHKYIAILAGIFTLVHIIGQIFNFYGLVTQTADDLACLFRQFYHESHVLPTFNTWCWETITGLTAMALTLQFFLIFVFSTPYARRYAFRAFWIVHLSYPLYFILMILHGAGRLVQAPFFYYFLLGPVILFVFDQLITFSRRTTDLTVVKADLLPSDVTHLEIKRPSNFEYKSGQWIRIACLARGENEYHPFTLTSAPHEDNLKLHIRACGPWTMAIRKLYDPRRLKDGKLPKVRVDGPYGEGNQEWPRYQVSIMVGGGIGVTPYASILKDISSKSRMGIKMACKKVYFIWITRTQSQFEWLTDILREVEEKDKRNLVNIQVYITQFKERFDIRTTMLYICEKHFHKISSKSLFTGLRAPTHFGRPDLPHVLRAIRDKHSDTSVFGVFSCGPPQMTHSVDKACAVENKYTQDVLFEHHEHNI